MAAAAAGWNQFYLYQSPSSLSRNPPHTAEQPGGKLMCFPIMKWNTAKNKFKRCLAGLPQQNSTLLISSLVFKHSCSLASASQKKLNALSGVRVDVYVKPTCRGAGLSWGGNL